MKMKKIFCICLVLSFVFLTACTPSLSSSVAEISSENSTIDSASVFMEDVLKFPQVEAPSAPSLGFAPNERMAVPIELEYEIISPSKEFLDALRNLDDESYNKLLDKDNYFNIGNYQLFFYDLAGLFGPAKICIVEPNGSIQEIFYSTQPIRRICFTLDKREIYVELLSIVYPEGYAGDTYKLDLLNEQLLPTKHEEFHLADLNGYMLYLGQQYCWHSDFNSGFRTLYKGANILGGETIVENIKTEPVFANGNVYYFKPDHNALYYRSLQADEYMYEMDIDIENPGWRFFIYENIIVYEDYDFNVIMIDMETGETIIKLPMYSIDSIANFSEKGLYFHSEDDELIVCDFEGNMTVLFTDVTEVFVEAVLGGWVYFSIRQLNSNGATPYGRVKLDGTELMYFL